MNVQAIGNQQVNFRSDNLQKATTFVNMNDDQLRDIAVVSSYDKHAEKKHKKQMAALFCTIPVADTIASGILPTLRDETGSLVRVSNATLGARGISAARTAGIWGIGLGTLFAYSAIKNSLTEHSTSVRHFEQNNPITSFIIDMGAIFSGFLLAQNGIFHIDQKLHKKAPKTADKIDSMVEKFYTRLNKTKINKKALPSIHESIDELSKSMPHTVSIGKGLIRNSALILLGVSVYKLFSASNKAQKRVDKTFNELKNAQLNTAKYLTNEIGVERDVLAQNQGKLAKELRNQMTTPDLEEEF